MPPNVPNGRWYLVANYNAVNAQALEGSAHSSRDDLRRSTGTPVEVLIKYRTVGDDPDTLPPLAFGQFQAGNLLTHDEAKALMLTPDWVLD